METLLVNIGLVAWRSRSTECQVSLDLPSAVGVSPSSPRVDDCLRRWTKVPRDVSSLVARFFKFVQLPKTERWNIVTAATLQQRFVEGLGTGTRGNEKGISDDISMIRRAFDRCCIALSGSGYHRYGQGAHLQNTVNTS